MPLRGIIPTPAGRFDDREDDRASGGTVVVPSSLAKLRLSNCIERSLLAWRLEMTD
jgi:hypothetical protein